MCSCLKPIHGACVLILLAVSKAPDYPFTGMGSFWSVFISDDVLSSTPIQTNRIIAHPDASPGNPGRMTMTRLLDVRPLAPHHLVLLCPTSSWSPITHPLPSPFLFSLSLSLSVQPVRASSCAFLA